jgi:hypothetical protein
MKEKPQKIDVQKLIEEFRGKDKVTIKAMRKEENGKWRVSYIEDKGKTDIIDFNSHHEAQEFCFAFGGKNHLTVSAPIELLDLSSWSESKLADMGHRLVSLTIATSYSSQNTDKKFKHEAPHGCGSRYLPGSNQTMPSKEKSGITFVERYTQRNAIAEKKVEFAEGDSLDSLCKWLFKNFPEYNLQVRKAVTLNSEFNALCVWVRKKVGDGSKRMQLRLDKLNGESFQNFMYSEILKVADGMASSECERIYMKRRTEVVEDRCGFSLA